jgi:hypothetical protein
MRPAFSSTSSLSESSSETSTSRAGWRSRTARKACGSAPACTLAMAPSRTRPDTVLVGGARNALGKGRRIRFVTHAEVDEASVDAAIGALAEIMPLRRTRRAHA